MDILGPRSQTLGTWLAFFLAGGWALYELRKDNQLPTGATMSGKLLPILLIVTLCVAAAMHLIAAIINHRPPKALKDKAEGVDPVKHKQAVDKLNECESLRRLEAGEVDRVKREYQDQLDLARKQYSDSNERSRILEQQLNASNSKVSELQNELYAPSGRFRLKRVRYIATQSRGRDLSEAGRLPEKDLTEFFDDKYVQNEKLIIPPGLYRKMFGTHNDPLIGVPKILEINYVHAGMEFSVLLPENISISIPFPYRVTQEHTG